MTQAAFSRYRKPSLPSHVAPAPPPDETVTMTDKIDALKTLYTRLVDSRDGYEQAKEHADKGAHAQLFADMLQRRRTNAAQVRDYIAKAGGTVDDDGSLLAAAHRQWLNLKDTFTSGDDAVLAEVVRGEESLLAAYDEAIAATGAGDPELSWLSQQYTDLKMTVDNLKAREARAA